MPKKSTSLSQIDQHEARFFYLEKLILSIDKQCISTNQLKIDLHGKKHNNFI